MLSAAPALSGANGATGDREPENAVIGRFQTSF